MVPFLIIFAAWAVVHSVTAAVGLKRIFRGRFGEKAYAGWYRLLYNLFSVLTFLPVYFLIPVLLPQTIIWQWTRPSAFIALFIQISAIIGLIYSLWVTDIWDFIGIRQVIWYFRGAEENTRIPNFTVNGPYAFVRHPLYFFSLLILWLNPVMTVGSLVFYLGATLYFWIGSYYEEKKLAAHFGPAYRDYQQRVPRLIPLPIRRYSKPDHISEVSETSEM